ADPNVPLTGRWPVRPPSHNSECLQIRPSHNEARTRMNEASPLPRREIPRPAKPILFSQTTLLFILPIRLPIHLLNADLLHQSHHDLMIGLVGGGMKMRISIFSPAWLSK